MSGGSRSGAGRKPIKVDLVELEKLAALHCTHEEIAFFTGVSAKTIHNKLRKREYREAYERGKAKGAVSLRREQMKCAAKGNSAMLQFLGKHMLGQRDAPVQSNGSKADKLSLDVIDEILGKDTRQK